MLKKEVNKCPLFEQCPLPYKGSHHCFIDYLKCKAYNILKNLEDIILKKIEKIIPNFTSISEKLDDLENKIKNLDTLKERVVNIENKKDGFEQIKNINQRIDSMLIHFEDKIKELNLSINERNKINDINHEIIIKGILNKEGIKNCKYCGSPIIWQQGTNGEWIPYHNTRNGMCWNYLNNDDDFDD